MAKDSQVVANTTRARRRPLTSEGIRRAVDDIRNELRKVTWPTPEQTRNLTLVVISVCIVVGAFLFIVDSLLAQVVKLIIGL